MIPLKPQNLKYPAQIGIDPYARLNASCPFA
jgi:hypothetical protein